MKSNVKLLLGILAAGGAVVLLKKRVFEPWLLKHDDKTLDRGMNLASKSGVKSLSSSASSASSGASSSTASAQPSSTTAPHDSAIRIPPNSTPEQAVAFLESSLPGGGAS